jgi:hypothetical protein
MSGGQLRDHGRVDPTRLLGQPAGIDAALLSSVATHAHVTLGTDTTATLVPR